jgi:hypothetical protein
VFYLGSFIIVDTPLNGIELAAQVPITFKEYFKAIAEFTVWASE